MKIALDPLSPSRQFDALAIRLPALGEDAGQLANTRPVVIFAEQGSLSAGLFERATAGGAARPSQGGWR